jgi:regulator of protease activity HflC (stomatin/prohibitin superfamily)
MSVPGQEVLTHDGLAVKVSLTVAVRTADPRRWHETVEDADAFVYAALQIALREVVAAGTLEELLASRGALADQVRMRVGAAPTGSGWRSRACRCGT